MKSIIVGFDPGLTAGIAILDLKGHVVSVESKKFMAPDDVRSYIIDFGRPIAISVDKSEASDAANKLAASFNCMVVSPDYDMGVDDKMEMVRGHPIFSNHERDALAAAFAAYNRFSDLFARIDVALTTMSLTQHSDRVKEMIINGEAKNIAEAISMITRPKHEPKQERVEEPRAEPKDREVRLRLRSLQKSHDIQKMYIERIEKKLKEVEKHKAGLMKDQLKKTEVGRRRVLKDKEIQLRDSMIAQLQHELRQEREERQKLSFIREKGGEYEKIVKGGSIPVVMVSNYSKESIATTDNEFRLRDKVLFFSKVQESLSATALLCELKPKVVIADLDAAAAEKLKKAGIIVAKGVVPEAHEWFGSLERRELESAVERSEKASFTEWLKEYKNRYII